MRIILFFLLILLITACRPSAPVIGDMVVIEEPKNYSETELKYSELLQIPPDSVKNQLMYEAIDKWNGYYENHKENIRETNGRFIQYVYYLTFDMRLPEITADIYKDNNIFLFKGLQYLKQGDLVFSNDPINKKMITSLYLQNGYLAFASEDGNLTFEKLDVKENNQEIEACGKVQRNEGR